MTTCFHQKSRSIWKRLALLLTACISLLLLTFLQGCILEDMEKCEQYELIVKIVDTDGYELPSGTVDTVNMYLFNSDGFVRAIPVGTGSDFMFGYNKDETLTIVAWGNLKQDSLVLPTLTRGLSLEEAMVELKGLENYNLSSTDIFYARYKVHSGSIIQESDSTTDATTRASVAETDTMSIVLNRKVASLSITGKYMSKRFGTDTTGYQFVIQNSRKALNFLGNLTGDIAYYKPWTSIEAGQLVTPAIRIFPTPSNEALTINLYRRDSLLYSTSTDYNGYPLQALAGKQLNVELDFRYSYVRVTVTVTPWGEVTQQTEL